MAQPGTNVALGELVVAPQPHKELRVGFIYCVPEVSDRTDTFMMPLKEHPFAKFWRRFKYAFNFFDRIVCRGIIGDEDANIVAYFELLNGAYQCRGNVRLFVITRYPDY